MRVNADFNERVVIAPQDHHWVGSPMPGVTRMMLDRIGGEVARATSLVRYAPDSEFPPHEHGGGEEILVLEGIFVDEHGRYPAGTYLRNPIGTRHAPRAGPEGALLFVKLHQFAPQDRRSAVIDTRRPAWLPGRIPGLSVMALHEYGPERVELVRWPPGCRLDPRRFHGGAELLVLEGAFDDLQGHHGLGTWLRIPPGDTLTAHGGAAGALLYLKSGHLASLHPSGTG